MPLQSPAQGRAPIAGVLIVALSATLFACLGPLSRWSYELGMTPLPFVAWRAAIGALVLAVAAAWSLRRGVRIVRFSQLDRRARGSLAAAVMASLMVNLSIFAAFDRIPIGLALLGFYTYPALVAVAAVVLGREQLTRAKLVALGLASGGMILVVAGGIDPGGVPLDPVGVGLALSASFSQVLFVTVSRDGYRAVPSEQAMGVVLLGTALVCLALALGAGLGEELLLPLEVPELVPLLIVAGSLGAAVPSLLFLVGIRWLGGTRTGILMLLEPVVGVVLAAWLLAEPFGLMQIAGGAAILVAAFIIQRTVEPGRPSGGPGTPPGPLGTDEAAELEETRLAPAPGGP